MSPEDKSELPVMLGEARRLATHPTGGRRATIAGVTFDARLPYELVVSQDAAEEVFERYGVTAERAASLLAHPLFRQALKAAEAELREAGLTFRTKARIMAEDLLEEGYSIATDPDAPANVRADLIKWAARMGDLEPAKKEGGGAALGGFHLHIDLGGEGPAKGRTIEVSSSAPDADVIQLLPDVDGVLVPKGGIHGYDARGSEEAEDSESGSE